MKMNLELIKVWALSLLSSSKMGRVAMKKGAFEIDGLMSTLLGIVFIAIAVVIVFAVFGGTIFQPGANSVGNFTKSITDQGTAVGGFSATLAPLLAGIVFLVAVVIVIALIAKHV